MYLNLDKFNVPMKMVYDLKNLKCERNSSEIVKLIRCLTLDDTRQWAGLNGTYGLYLSKEWWNNIELGNIKLKYFNGIIQKAFKGIPDSQEIDTMHLKLPGGSVKSECIYVANETDISFFKQGHYICGVYALDEIKPQAQKNLNQKYSEIALEMAVSLHPIE